MHEANEFSPSRDGSEPQSCASFQQGVRNCIRLFDGLGVEGDAHLGITVKHRSRVAADPTQPNLRQVHLIHAELHDELVAKDFWVAPGVMDENVITRGLDLLGLPRGARLRFGMSALVEVTGLRSPCKQLNDFQAGLLAAVLDRDAQGRLVPKAGTTGVVLAGCEIRPGDSIEVELPSYQWLEQV